MGATSVYVKLFGTILQSSIWEQDNATRIVWITMLALADMDGYVKSSLSGLARTAAVTLEECRKAISCLQGPDLESGTQEYAGRRIEAVEGGWVLLNYKKYREIRTPQQLRNAQRQARYRQAHGAKPALPVTPVTTNASASDSEKHSEAKAVGRNVTSNGSKRITAEDANAIRAMAGEEVEP